LHTKLNIMFCGVSLALIILTLIIMTSTVTLSSNPKRWGKIHDGDFWEWIDVRRKVFFLGVANIHDPFSALMLLVG